MGSSLAYGVLMPSVKSHYGCSTVIVAAIGSVRLAVMFLFSIPFASLADYFGFKIATVGGCLLATTSLVISAYSTSWQIFLVSYGVVAGFGFGVATFICQSCPSMFFEKWLSVANAIVFSGNSIGKLMFAPMLSLVLENYGLKMALLMEAVLSMTASIMGLLIVSPPFDNYQTIDDKTTQKAGSNMKKVLTNGRFIINLTGFAFANLVLSIPVLFIPSLLTEQGLTLQEASFAISIMGITNTVGRLLCGLVDLYPQHTIKTLGFASLGSGMTMVFMVPFKSITMSYTVCAFHGLLSGPIMSLSHAVKLRLLDREQLLTACGISETITGITILAGLYLARHFCKSGAEK